MSVAGANGVRFTATISSNVPLPNTNVLLASWYKKNSTDPGSIDYLAQMTTASQASRIYTQIGNNSGYKIKGIARWQASGGADPTLQHTTAVTQDVWRLAGTFLAADGAASASIGYSTYDNGTEIASTFATTGDATQGLTALALGDGGAFSSLTHWQGRHCEHACFLVSGGAQADTIMSELATKTADLVASEQGATLVFYYPLLGDTTAVAGPALTTVGSPTWDAGDHPSLSSGSADDGHLLIQLMQ